MPRILAWPKSGAAYGVEPTPDSSIVSNSELREHSGKPAVGGAPAEA
jgi:hypothetical protein